MAKLDPELQDLVGRCPKVLGRFREILGDIEEERKGFPRLFRSIASRLHGIDHTVRVALLGLAIAEALRRQEMVEDRDLAPSDRLEDAVLLAAFFHDCARTTDGSEPEHGREGEAVWRSWSLRKGILRPLREAVSQAILFHVAHDPVDPAAGPAAICLANADRLDRVRLGESPRPELMYDDGAWASLVPHTRDLLGAVTLDRVRAELGI